jgi:hypothetical protein
MTRIRCRERRCMFNKNGICTSDEIEYEPDAGCLTMELRAADEEEEEWEEDEEELEEAGLEDEEEEDLEEDDDWDDEDEGEDLGIGRRKR